MADATRPLLERLLHTPNLAKAVPQLPPQVLHRVIQQWGLEECAEIVALATPAQIERVLDADLWRAPSPGGDEAFDAGRFGEWLEVLMLAGEDVAIEKIAAIDSDLVVTGFSQHVSVFDAAAVSSYTTLDGEHIDGRAFERVETAEIGGFIVGARRATAWETIVEVLAALNVERPDYFRRLMRACVALSSGEREEDASHNLLLDDRDQDMFDLASAREARRDAVGYVTAADARAFLQSGRELRVDRGQPTADPVAQAYFRSLASADAETAAGASMEDASAQHPQDVPPAGNADVAAVIEVLSDAGVIDQPRALLMTGDRAPGGFPHLRKYLETTPSGADELAYLTNLVIAGGAIQGRALSAQEAPDMAAATCNLGLEKWPGQWTDATLVTAFQVGWNALYRDVCLYAAESLIDTLAAVQLADREVQLMVNQLRRELIRHGQAGSPWKARESFDAIMILDASSWMVLLGLIDETPTLHRAAASKASSVRRVDPSDFEFIASNEQIRTTRDFLAGLAKTLRE